MIATTALLLVVLWVDTLLRVERQLAEAMQPQVPATVQQWVKQHAREDMRVSATLTLVLLSVAGVVVLTLRRQVAAEAQLERAQAKAEAESQLLRLVTENIPVAIAFFDHRRRLMFANGVYARMLGAQEAGEVVGRHMQDLVPPQRQALHDQHAAQAYAGTAVRYETDLPGSGARAEYTLTPQFGPDQRVHGVFGTVVDISERTRAAALARLREQELRLLSEHLPAYISRYDEHRVLHYANARWAATVGRPIEEAVGRGFAELVGPERARSQEPFVQRVLMGETVQYELRHITKPGATMDVTLVPCRGPDGQRRGWYAFAVDVSERKETEAALQRNNADLEQFAYSISHDLRSPLRAISGHLQLLGRSLDEGLAPADAQALAFALDGAKRMDAMIVSLLEYSRVGRIEVERNPLETHDVLGEALGFLAPQVAETAAQIDVVGEWPRIQASRPELSRLLQNLISNALKFRVAGTPPQVHLVSSVANGLWQLQVKDNGVGIAPAQIQRLFGLFSRLHSRSEFEGTGMGLALCRRIVEHHQGRIWAESDGPGRGSRFVFELPI